MAATGPEPGSMLETLRRIAGSFLGLAQNRIELFGVELRIEQTRLAALLVWLGIGLLLALMGVVVVSVLVAILVWQSARIPGLLALGVVLLGSAAVVFWLVRRRLRSAPKPFPETIAQLAKDCACLRKED